MLGLFIENTGLFLASIMVYLALICTIRFKHSKLIERLLELISFLFMALYLFIEVMAKNIHDISP